MSLTRIVNPLHKKIFQILVFLFPTQIALHLWPHWAFVYGVRIDYLSLALYLTDIIIFFLLIASLLDRKSFSFKGFKRVSMGLFFLILVYVYINIMKADNPQVALIKWLKLLEFTFLGSYLVYRKNFKMNGWVKKPMIASLIFFGLIGLAQFYFQKTIGGWLYFLGERSFSTTTPGIALFNVLGKTGLRAYSTFSHPNSLAGFFVVSYFLLSSMWGVKGVSVTKVIVAVISFLVLLASFSVGAGITFVLVGLMMVFLRKKKSFSLVTKATFLTVIVISFVFLLISRDFDNQFNFPEKIGKRLELTQAAGKIFSKEPLIGVGLNNFIVELPHTDLKPTTVWRLQPVHNIFLLVLAEGGLVGMLLITACLYQACLNLLSKNVRYLTIAFLTILLTGIFDHYWLTLQQNQLLFSLVLGLSFRKKIS